MNSNKLYVGNLSYDTQNADLEELFSSTGNVESVNLIKDNATQRTKGFAFIEMQNKEDAEKAIEELDGKDFMGRAIKVSVARERESRSNNNHRDRRW